MQVDPNDPRPAYLQIADDIARSIEAGALEPGQRLPSGRELAKRYEVAPMTVQQALRELRDRRLVVAWQGRGVFVRGADEQATVDGRPTIARIMTRLEAMHDDLHRLEDRVAALEKRSQRTQTPGRRGDS